MQFKGNYVGDTLSNTFARVVEDKLYVGTNIDTVITNGDAHNASVITIPANVIQAGDILQVRGMVTAETYLTTQNMTVAFRGPDGLGATTELVTTTNTDTDDGDYFIVSADVKVQSVSSTDLTATYRASLEWWDLDASTTAPTQKLHDVTRNATSYDTAVATLFAINVNLEVGTLGDVRVAEFYCHLIRPN